MVGVAGESSVASGNGVYALSSHNRGYGIYANNTGGGVAGYFITDGNQEGIYAFNSGAGGTGVFGESNSTGNSGVGVVGYGLGPEATGGDFWAGNDTGPTYGVTAVAGDTTSATSATAVYAYTTAPTGSGNYAGLFTGVLSATTKTFRIDHPLDPANKWLVHSCVESPDMMNVYNGIVETDATGAAEVVLPSYFQALNCNFRYQLTPLGGPAPNLHIASEVASGRFAIGGGAPRQRVSWQVTGIRQDAFAKARPVIVEDDKQPHEKGLYQHPEVHGQPAQKGISWAHSERARTRTTEHGARRSAARPPLQWSPVG